MDESLETPLEGNGPAPRMTKLWQGQVRLLREAIGDALTDPTIRAYWGRTAELFARTRGVRVEFSDSRTERLVALIRGTARDAWKSLEALAGQCRERAPALEHTFGPYLDLCCSPSFMQNRG